jgi:hypothetical protein
VCIDTQELDCYRGIGGSLIHGRRSGDDPALASYLRIKERELEAGGVELSAALPSTQPSDASSGRTGARQVGGTAVRLVAYIHPSCFRLITSFQILVI